MQDLRVTLVQSELDWEDAAANRARCERLLEGIAGNSDVIVLAEMFTSGFSMNAPALAETPDGPSTEWMAAMAAATGAAVCGSLIVKDGANYYNRLQWLAPDGSRQHYDKRHLFRFAGEHEVYSPGNRRLVVEHCGWRICPLICYDLRFPVWSRSRNDCDLLIYVANWPVRRINAWSTLLEARAIENACYVAAVNRTGIDGNEVPYCGASAVYDYLGEALIPPRDGEHVSTATLQSARLQDFRSKFPAHLDADSFTIQC